MMDRIQDISIEWLEHHPENPRKDLGDLTELAESIRANGILQNLTVVPAGKTTANGYEIFWVVIGNRRMEAAKKAGLKSLPCIVSDMDRKTQVATMLEENMQRSDLTAFEQAQGFQMMMDLGFTEAEISEKTGFSRTTVSRRLKMAELDENAFRKAVGKQITMDDLDKLGQIKSIKQRNAILKNYGEDNFNWLLSTAIRKQKAAEKKPKVMEIVREKGIPELAQKDRYSSKYQRLYNLTIDFAKWREGEDVGPKDPEGWFYLADEDRVEFYEKVKKPEPVRKSEAERAEEVRIENVWKIAERCEETARELRREFAEGMTVSPKNAMEMMQWALVAACCMIFDYNTPSKQLREQIPLTGYYTPKTMEEVHAWIKAMPQSKWPALILKFFEGDHAETFTSGPRRAMPKWQENRKLDLCYEWLKAFGYRMSEEEEEIRKGTHRVFQEKM